VKLAFLQGRNASGAVVIAPGPELDLVDYYHSALNAGTFSTPTSAVERFCVTEFYTMV